MHDRTLLLIPLSTHLPCARPLYEIYAELLRSFSNADVLIPNFGNASLGFIPEAELVESIRETVARHLRASVRPPLAEGTLALHVRVQDSTLFLEILRLEPHGTSYHGGCLIGPPDWDGIGHGLHHILRAIPEGVEFDEISFLNAKLDCGPETAFLLQFGITLAELRRFEHF
jgi:hypothetical protein